MRKFYEKDLNQQIKVNIRELKVMIFNGIQDRPKFIFGGHQFYVR